MNNEFICIDIQNDNYILTDDIEWYTHKKVDTIQASKHALMTTYKHRVLNLIQYGHDSMALLDVRNLNEEKVNFGYRYELFKSRFKALRNRYYNLDEYISCFAQLLKMIETVNLVCCELDSADIRLIFDEDACDLKSLTGNNKRVINNIRKASKELYSFLNRKYIKIREGTVEKKNWLWRDIFTVCRDGEYTLREGMTLMSSFSSGKAGQIYGMITDYFIAANNLLLQIDKVTGIDDISEDIFDIKCKYAVNQSMIKRLCGIWQVIELKSDAPMCVQKIRNNYGVITHYVLKYTFGKEITITAATVKQLLAQDDSAISNLKLTSNGRVIDKR